MIQSMHPESFQDLTEISFRSRFQTLATAKSVSGKEPTVFSSLEEVVESVDVARSRIQERVLKGWS
jgi:hypothetical protein